MTDRDIRDDDDVYTLADWRAAVRAGYFNEYDGSGCFAKDGKFIFPDRVFDDVFAEPPDGATHVVWFNK